MLLDKRNVRSSGVVYELSDKVHSQALGFDSGSHESTAEVSPLPARRLITGNLYEPKLMLPTGSGEATAFYALREYDCRARSVSIFNWGFIDRNVIFSPFVVAGRRAKTC